MNNRTAPLWLDSLSKDARLADHPGDRKGERLENGAAFVPSSQCMSLALPRLPTSRRELAAMIRERAPLPAGKLAWTEPAADGGGDISTIIVRRDWLDRFVEDTERAGKRIERVYAEELGLRFDYRTAAQRRRGIITAVFWIGAAMAAAAAVSLSATPTESTHLASTANPASDQTPVPAEAFAYNSVAADLSAVSRLANANIELSRIERMRNGSVLLEIRSAEPDGLRQAVSQQELLPGFTEASQKIDEGGNYLIAYRRKAGDPMPSSVRADLLGAGAGAEAAMRVRQILESHARSNVVQVNLATPATEQARLMAFPFELVGPQSDVLHIAERIESTPPPMRFAEWALSPAPEGVRLSGVLHVPWQLASS